MGWVDEQVQATGKTVRSILLEQFLKSLLAFNFYSDPTFHYRPGIPLLQFVPSILFIFGLAYAIGQWKKREYFLLFTWFMLVVIFGSTLLENPPSAHRLLLAIPPVVILVALGMVKLSSYVQQALSQPRSLAVGISLFMVLFCGFQSVHFYFNQYTPSHAFAGPNTEVADRLGRYLRDLGPEYQCYFFGAPRIYYGHATIPYLARGVAGMDILNPIHDNVDFVNPERKAVFAFLPERRAELDVVQHFYPSGALREFRDKRGQQLFITYEVDG